MNPVSSVRLMDCIAGMAEYPDKYFEKVNGDSSFSDCEEAYCSFHDSIRLFRFMWNGAMQGKSCTEGWIMQGDKSKNETRIHQTQKPIALYEWLLKNYAKPGDKILDTHLGSGSSRIAAYKQGFDFYGFEIDPDYFMDADKRFRESIAMPLFDSVERPIQLDIFSYKATTP